MKSRICFGAGIAIAIVFAVIKSTHAADAGGAKMAQIKRGEYIVERVGMCADCHTPRTQTGEFNRSLWLQGSALDFRPMHPIPGFATVAPQIAGLPTFATDELA